MHLFQLLGSAPSISQPIHLEICICEQGKLVAEKKGKVLLIQILMRNIISISIVQSGINYGSLVLSLLLIVGPAATSFVYSDRAHSQADPV